MSRDSGTGSEGDLRGADGAGDRKDARKLERRPLPPDQTVQPFPGMRGPDLARRQGRPSRWRADARRRRLLATADVVAGSIALGIGVTAVGVPGWAFALLPLWVVVAKAVGLYDRDHRALRHLTVDELPQIAGWAGLSVGLLILVSPLTTSGEIDLRGAVGLWAVAAASAAFLRGFVRLMWWRLSDPEVAAVIGEGSAAAAIRRKVELFGDMHIDISEVHHPRDIAGDVDRIEDLAGRVDRVVLAVDHIDVELIGRIADVCRREQVKLSVVSPLRGRATPAPRIEQLADLPVLEYRTWDVSRSTWAIKRTLDVVVSAALLVLLLPLTPLLALAIRLDSPGPVFFTQIRAGIHGRPFRMYKLRTMVQEAESQLEELVDIHRLPEPVFKLRDDPRVTRVGRLLRRFSIDELPQLLNVLLGEMSLVGPRPEQVELVESQDPRHRARHRVRPGITGPMQVYGRGALSFQERLAVELDYVENLSVARDLRIMIHTIPVTLRGTGAF